MKKLVAPIALTLCLASMAVGAQSLLQDIEKALPGNNPSPSQVNDTRQQVRDMSRSALDSLAQLAPAARAAIDKAAGYAVFSTFGVKILVAGGTTGRGLVVNQRTNAQTFMKMVQVQGGLGFGLNQNRLIFVFTNEPALRSFVEQGWEFGSRANLSAMAGGEGAMMSGAASIAPGVYLYQLTDTGLSATLTLSGRSSSSIPSSTDALRAPALPVIGDSYKLCSVTPHAFTAAARQGVFAGATRKEMKQ